MGGSRLPRRPRARGRISSGTPVTRPSPGKSMLTLPWPSGRGPREGGSVGTPKTDATFGAAAVPVVVGPVLLTTPGELVVPAGLTAPGITPVPTEPLTGPT